MCYCNVLKVLGTARAKAVSGLADNTSFDQHAPNGAQMTQNQKTKERESRKFEVGSEVFIYSIEYLITDKVVKSVLDCCMFVLSKSHLTEWRGWFLQDDPSLRPLLSHYSCRQS